MRTPAEALASLTGESDKGASEVRKARSKWWIGNILRSLDCTPHILDAILSGDNKSTSGLPEKWVDGSVIVTEKSVLKVAKKLEERKLLFGSEEFYLPPLYEFLENKPLSKTKINKLLEPYRFHGGLFNKVWEFPNDAQLLKEERYSPIIHEEDSDQLFQRGDVYGFTTILGLVRRAEAERNDVHHQAHMANAYRSLPTIGKLPYFADYIDEIKEWLFRIHTRFHSSATSFRPDWDVIDRQIKDKDFEPFRLKRKRDPNTYRFVDLEEPIIYFADR